MVGIIRHIFMAYVMMGLEEDWWLHNSLAATGKLNVVYRIYKRLNRAFRIEANNYVFDGDLFNLHLKSMHWLGA